MKNLNFYQKTGGKDEIQNALNTVNKFNNCILLANNFMKIRAHATSNYHFFDTNDYSYNLPKFNSLNIIELSVLKNKYFGGNYHYYNEYPSLNYFNKIKNYKTPDLSNVEIYHGNSLQDCIELFKTKHTDKNLKLFFHDEILNELLNDYKTVKSENDLYDLNLLVNPTISFKGKLNSERLIFLLRQIERSKRNDSITIILTTKNINLKESLKNSNITKWSKEELVSRNKWGPNLNHKVFKFSSDSIIKYENIRSHVKINQLNLTQGFIASDKNNFNVTLGREGSDYSAAIFAYAINAESLTIWKDVEGLLNGDPKYFKNTKLIKNISYSEAIELAFYGASVIHPKTLQPVQKKEIPLYVKSFEKPNQKGTEINKNLDLSPKVPCYIFKNNMIFIKIFSLDFSFAIDKNLSHIFKKIDEFKMKVDIIQNSAISFSICLFDKYNQIDNLIKSLEDKFKIEVYKNISLYTIRHFDEQAIKVVSKGKKLLLEQRSEKTVKLIFKN